MMNLISGRWWRNGSGGLNLKLDSQFQKKGVVCYLAPSRVGLGKLLSIGKED